MMRRFTPVVVAVAMAVPTLPVLAQDQPGNVGMFIFVQPQAGNVAEYEAAYKEHAAWHRSQNDSWNWPVWEITSGPRTGQLVVGSIGHEWKDFDERGEFGEKDRAEAVANLSPLTESVKREYWIYQPELSNPPTGDGGPVNGVAYYAHLNQDMVGEYNVAARKIQAAITKSDWGGRYFRNRLVASGEDPTIVRWSVRQSWADFGPSETSFPKMLEGEYGRAEAQSILDTLNRATHCRRSEIWTYRSDLSYFPAQ